MVTSDDYSITKFLKKWDEGHFVSSRQSMIEAGWYDWFCEDEKLFKRLEKMVPRIRAISKSDLIDKNWTHASFKNCWGARVYDRFELTLIPPFYRQEKGKFISTLYMIQMIEGHGEHGEDPKNRPILYTYKDNFTKPVATGWRDIYKFFGVNHRKRVIKVTQIKKVKAFNRFAEIDLV